MAPIPGVLPAEWDLDDVQQILAHAEDTDDPDDLHASINALAELATEACQRLANVEHDDAVDITWESPALTAAELFELRQAAHTDDPHVIDEALATIATRLGTPADRRGTPAWLLPILAAGATAYLRHHRLDQAEPEQTTPTPHPTGDDPAPQPSPPPTFQPAQTGTDPAGTQAQPTTAGLDDHADAGDGW